MDHQCSSLLLQYLLDRIQEARMRTDDSVTVRLLYHVDNCFRGIPWGHRVWLGWDASER